MACRLVWDLARTVEGSPQRSACLEDLARRLAEYRTFVRARTVAFSTMHLTSVARERDIPFRVQTQGRVLFGQGAHQRQTWDAYTDRTSLFSVRASNNKAQTNARLRAMGLPVPRQVVVSDEDGAVAAAREIGGAVVLKPLDAHQGRGVSVGLDDESDVRAAFRTARRIARNVIVEQFIPGDDHRLLVIGGRLVAAAIRVRAHVVGDGKRTVAALIDLTNKDPLRGEDHDNAMTNLVLDKDAENVLAEQGHTRDTVPAAGETVYLSKTANIATGGSAIDVTDRMHDDNRQMAEDAALAVGLDIAGIDFLTTDITRSHRDAGGGICEINCTPGLTPHYASEASSVPPVANAILDHLYPAGTPSRIAIVAILSEPESPAPFVSLLVRLLRAGGRTVGALTQGGYAVDGRRTLSDFRPGPEATLEVLADPRIDTAILEVSRQAFLDGGLGFDSCSVAAVLEPGDDARADRRLLDIARDSVVSAANDRDTLGLAEQRDKPCIRVFHDGEDPPAGLPPDAGTRAVLWTPQSGGGSVDLHDGSARRALAHVSGIAEARDVKGLVFAVATAWALGLDPATIADALRDD